MKRSRRSKLPERRSRRNEPVLRLKHRMDYDEGPQAEFEVFGPVPEHSPAPKARKNHELPDALVLDSFDVLDGNHRLVFEVLYGLGGRGALMDYDEIAYFFKTYLKKTLTVDDISELEAEALKIVCPQRASDEMANA